MYKKILFPVDFSNISDSAISKVINTAKNFDSEVIILSVIDFPDKFHGNDSEHYVYLKKIKQNYLEKSKKSLEKVKNIFQENGIGVITEFKSGHVGNTVSDYANTTDVDLIMMNNRGYGSIKSILLGSVSNYVLNHSKKPVMIINNPK